MTTSVAVPSESFRPLLADLLWLRANVLWERRERSQLTGVLRAVVAIDPRPLPFWLNGARMMAYDFPAWRIAELGGSAAIPAAVQHHLRLEQAEQALAWLDRARAFHPRAPAILVEQANICLYALQDPARAAEGYRQAAELPQAPAYAGRLHARLLRVLGKREEALAWLIRLQTRLAQEGPSAADTLAREEIRELEEELQIPFRDRFQPGPGAAKREAGIDL